MFGAKRIFDIDQVLSKKDTVAYYSAYHDTYDFEEHHKKSISLFRKDLAKTSTKEWHDTFYNKAMPPRFEILQKSLEESSKQKFGMSMLNSYLHYVPYLEWRKKSRVCYTVHEGLSDDFKDVKEIIKVDIEHLKHLPHNEMYFDLRTFGLKDKECEISGAFVKVIMGDDYAFIFIGLFDSKDNAILGGGTCMFISECCADNDGIYNVHMNNLENLDGLAIYYVTSLLVYVCSDENDVSEVITTRNKNSNKVKHSHHTSNNKPKEYQVGYRIGPKLQYAKKQYESLCQSGNNKMRPHVRRGHWSHYWVGRHGTADRRRIIKWVSKQYINCENAEMIDIVDSLVDDTVHSKAV